jgi:glyoxylase-like metal-dependent hydrolase (beta-lactamase superfamily II)
MQTINNYSIKSIYYKYSILLGIVLACSKLALADFLPAKEVDTSEIPEIVISANAGDKQSLPFYKISGNTYFLYGNIAEIDDKNRGFNGNAGFIVTPAGVVVIDSLGSPRLGKRLIATIKSVTSSPIKYLILTHNHPDHSYGAIAFKNIPGIRIIGHEGTLDYLNSENFQNSVTFRNNLIAKDMQGFAGVTPDILVGGKLHDRYSFKLGGKTFAIYNTGQHHSFGDLIVHQVEDRQLWISDLAFNNRSTFMGDGHSAQVLEGIDWIRQQFPDTTLMIPGHGSAQTAPFPMLDRTYQYVKRLRDEMKTALASGQDLATAVRNSDFEDWHKTPLYFENHKKNANFIYLEMEQELF